MVGTFFLWAIFSCFLHLAFAVKSDHKLISTRKKKKTIIWEKSMLNEIDLWFRVTIQWLFNKYKYSITSFFSLSIFCFCFITDIAKWKEKCSLSVIVFKYTLIVGTRCKQSYCFLLLIKGRCKLNCFLITSEF